MPTFERKATAATFGLDVIRRGWGRGVLVTLHSPKPTSWQMLAGDDADTARESWDGAATITGTLVIERVDSDVHLFEREYDGAYATYLGFPMIFDDEVPYGESWAFMAFGVVVTFSFNGVIDPISVEVVDEVWYRQVEDTESWGSEHERKLFIPHQNPVPS